MGGLPTSLSSSHSDLEALMLTSPRWLKSGDIMEVVVDVRKVFRFNMASLDSSYEGIQPRTDFSIQLRPEVGTPVILEFRTPGAYYNNKYITLVR